MKKLLFKTIPIICIGLVLIVSNACRKPVEWPTTTEQGGSSNTGNPNGLDSIAVYNIIIAANTTPTSTVPVSTTPKVSKITNYFYSVTYSIYAPSDVNYTTPLYSAVYKAPIPPKSSTNSAPIEIDLKISIPAKYNCIERSQFVVTKIAQIILDSTKSSMGNKYQKYDTSYAYIQEGGLVDVSNNCESFKQGIGSDNNSHMIFNQTGMSIVQ